MRKVFALLLILAVLLCGCSTGKQVKASNMAVSIGKQAVQLIDDYLDGTKNARDVQSQLMELYEKTNYASEHTAKDWTEEQRDDWFIHSSILSAEANIGFYAYDSTPEKYDKIIECRNKIAELVGVDKR